MHEAIALPLPGANGKPPLGENDWETAETIQAPQTAWPAALGEDAYHGLVGRMVTFIAPYVESDEPSTLAQFLTGFGIAAGRQPHFMVGATRHAPATYLGLVGRTSRARKGTSWDPIKTLFRGADPSFSNRVLSGLGSGERLVYLVRDPSLDKDGQVTEPGAEDRRLLLQEAELARLLTVINRESSTLSAYLRVAYDGQPLINEVKTNAARASVHHIGLVGHCTEEDLVGQLKEQEIRNGLANRILWVLARRDKKLPDPPVFEGPKVAEAISELRAALVNAQLVDRLRRHAAAQRLWNDWYLSLPDDETGMLGAITNRAEAQVIRLSMIYALTDGSEIIGVDHLRAAITLWEFSTRCCVHIFGSSTGNLVADRIREELRRGPLLRSEISHELFGRNLPAQSLLEAQRVLERRGLLVRELLPSTGGRRPEQWRKP